MGRSSTKKNWLLIFAIGCLLAFASSESANADGCWGSSRGGWGSGGSMGGGSFGCRGGLFQNAPVRNLLSRLGNRVGNGLANLGDGIGGVLEQRPLRSALFGCRGGWGSRGLGSRGSYGSSGGSTGGWGSNGGWGCGGSLAASPGYSQQSYISAPAPTYAAPLINAGSFIGDAGGFIGDSGSTSLLDMPIVSVDSYGSVGSISAYVDPVVSYDAAGTVGQYETSAPALDYGYYGTQFGTIGVPTDAAMIGGAMITGPMMEAPLGEANGEAILSPGGDDLPGNEYYENGSEPTPDDAFGASEDDDSAYIPRGKAILSLDVPQDAKVFINDKLTQTNGTRRSYVSRNLLRGQDYRYRVKVVSEVEGKEIVKSRVVTMRVGESNQLAFNFKPVVTRVVVSVPDDAKVMIDGKETSTTGAYRSFSTQKLKSGKWDDYSVEVSVVRDGKQITRKEKFDLAAGEFRFFEFDFDKDASGSIASK